MRRQHKVLLLSVSIASAAFVMIAGAEPVAAAFARAKRVIAWDLAALAKPPVIHATTERPAKGMRAFFYEGADYKGKPTWVFA
ncbi:MAG: hypothetical protein WCN95_08985, partial [bacterium]